MNRTDFSLQRLFRSAARAAEPLPAEAPFWLETRVIASWRSNVPEPLGMLTGLFRGAVVCACVIIVISTALTLGSLREPAPNELVIVDSVLQISLMQ